MPSSSQTETFQHYQVLRRPDGTLFELGHGAMGVTYKAFDTNLRCDVALKVINALHLHSETARARFLREARAAAGLRHRNVASVYHLGNDEHSFFYAMEWVDGLTVELMVKEKGAALAVEDALQIALQVARALGAASRQGLVHRDIKPANIMVAHEDDEEDQFVVKVIDFGLARSAVGSEGSANITIGGFVGTPQYASPEQLEEKDLDVRSDIYSLGVTLWYMLAGRAPFTGPLGSVFIQQMTKEPPWEQVAGLPEPVRALLAHVLQKDPEQRPQTALELRREIEACLKSLPPELNRAGAGGPSFGGGDDTSADSNTASSEEPGAGLSGDAAPARASASAFTLGAGTTLAGRYELAALAGDGTNGRVFRARDLTHGGQVAVKVFHLGVLALEAERRRLQETIDKLHVSPHPRLKEVFEFSEAADSPYLVEEWVNGFSLVDVLRSRGRLSAAEALALLAQIAEAADHARSHGLSRLELSLHQILAHFPAAAPTDETPASRTILTETVGRWPEFSLKLDALGITREAGDSVTWMGDMTRLPKALSLGRDTQTSIRGLVESTFLFSLGALVYELLSGTPPALGRSSEGRSSQYVALPALNEAANTVLRQVLSSNPTYTSGAEFFEALSQANSGGAPAALPPAGAEESLTLVDHAETMILDELKAPSAASEASGEMLRVDLDAGLEEEARLAEEARLVEEAIVQAEQAAEAARENARLDAVAETGIAAVLRAAEEARLVAHSEAGLGRRSAAEEARLVVLRLVDEARADELRAIEETRLAAEQQAEETRVAAELRAAEDARLAEQQAAEEARQAAELRAAEEARVAAELRAAEEARLAKQQAADKARQAAELRAAEEAHAAELRLAEEARQAANLKAAEEARATELRLAEEARQAAELKAAEEARATELRLAEEARQAAELRAAEEARVAAEQARVAAEQRAAEKARLAAENLAAAEARKAEQVRAAAEAKAAQEARLASQAVATGPATTSALPKRALVGAGAVVVTASALAVLFLRPAHRAVPPPTISNSATPAATATPLTAVSTPTLAIAAVAQPPATPTAEALPPVAMTTPESVADVPPTPSPAPSVSAIVPVPSTPAPVAATTSPTPGGAHATSHGTPHTTSDARKRDAAADPAKPKKEAVAEAKPAPKKQPPKPAAATPAPSDGFMR